MQYTKPQIGLIFLGLVVIVGTSFVVGLMWGHHLASSSFEKLLPRETELARQLSAKRKSLTFYEAIREKEPGLEGDLKETGNLSEKKNRAMKAPARKGSYKIQVASFLEKRRADVLTRKLVRKGLKTRVVLANGKDGKLWHLVQVVDISGRKKAENLILEIKKNFGMKSLLVKVK